MNAAEQPCGGCGHPKHWRECRAPGCACRRRGPHPDSADPFTLLTDDELAAMTDRAYWDAARAWRLAPAEAPDADAYYQRLRAEATRRGTPNKRAADRRAVDVARDLDATLARRARMNSASQLTGEYETMNTALPVGTFTDHGQRYQLRVDLRIEPAQLRETGRTINHEPIPADAVEIAITGETWHATADGSRDRRYGDMAGGGQNIDDLRRVPGARAARIAELWDRWHLNGMRPGCAHQGDAWTCTATRTPKRASSAAGPAPTPTNVAPSLCGTLNGWPIVRDLFGEHPYPKRGDACHVCDRARWDEPTDACPESGYRYGTAWLYEPVPPEIVAELRALFGQRDPSARLPGEAMPRTAHDVLA